MYAADTTWKAPEMNYHGQGFIGIRVVSNSHAYMFYDNSPLFFCFDAFKC